MHLAQPTLDDRAQVFDWMNAPGILEFMMGPPTFPDVEPPEDLDEFCEDWVDHYWTWAAPEKGRAFIMRHDGEAVGFIAHNDVVTLEDGRRATELDMWMSGPRATGRGYAPMAVNQLCDRLVAELKVDVAFLQPSARNPRSIRAYEKCGFERIPGDAKSLAAAYGTSTDYFDSVFMARVLARTGDT